MKVLVKAREDDFKPWLPKEAALKGRINVEKELLIGFDPTSCLIQDLKARFLAQVMNIEHMVLNTVIFMSASFFIPGEVW